MAAYSFNSEPRVVSTRSEKYKPEDRMSMNLMYDKRVFRGHVHDIHNIRPVLSPQEQEELHLQKEKEKKRDEMMKRQLDAFKKNKVKQSPYDIRPAATGRIEVDLQYFLTDQKDVKPNNSDVPVQTDDFVAKPPDPVYVPKKTGKDVITQIEDGDLFCFNVEVQPILNVLISKTMEQALLEVEEESEMEAMSNYKAENLARKIEEEKSWAHMVKEEAEKIQKKNQEVQLARMKYVKTMNLATKLQNLNLAKNYLSGLVPKILDEVTGAILQADNFENLLSQDFLPFILEGTKEYLEKKEKLNHMFHDKALRCAHEMKEKREKLVRNHKQKARKEQIRNINYSDTKRFFRVLYLNPKFYVQSEFTMRMGYMLRGEEYPENMNDSILMKDPEKKEGEEPGDPEAKKESKPEWAKFLTFLVDDIKKIGFTVANHPNQDTPKDLRKYGIVAEFYSDSGEIIGSVDGNSSEKIPGVKYNGSCRDMTKKSSNDEMIIISPHSLPSNIHHVFLFTYSIRPLNTEFKYAKYQLLDYETTQRIDCKNIKLDEFTADDNGQIMPLYMAYRISRQESNPRHLKIVMNEDSPVVEMPNEDPHWVLEVFNMPMSKPLEEATLMIKQLLKDGWNYSRQLYEGLVNYRTMKLLQEIEYKKEMEENEQPGSKKKKKRPAKGKVIEEPVKMTEYVPPPPTYSSKSFGPIMIDTENDTLNTLLDKMTQNVDPELVATWDLGLEVYVKNKPLKKIKWVLKAHSLKDFTIDKKIPEEPAILADINKEVVDS